MKLEDKWFEDRQWTEGYFNFDYYRLGYNRRSKEVSHLESMVENFINLFQENHDCIGPKVSDDCARCTVNQFAAEFLKYQTEGAEK